MSNEQGLVEFFVHISKAVAVLAQCGGVNSEATVNIIPAAFNRNDAAKYCGFSYSTLSRYREKGWIKTIDVDGRPKYLRKKLDKLLERIEHESR